MDNGDFTRTKEQLNLWLKGIENRHLLGRFKVWCFQYGVCPCLQWSFLLYDFPVSKVEGMERLCSKFLQKCLGVPPSFTTVNLYSKTSKLPLPVLSVFEDFKATKVMAVGTLISKDGRVRTTSQNLRCSSRKWEVLCEVSPWKHHEVVGPLCLVEVRTWSKADARGAEG